jgi:hypothetical protein
MSAVQRYSKTFLLTRSRAQFGPRIIGRGAKFLEDPRGEIIKAIREGPRAGTPLGKALISRLASGPHFFDSSEDVRPGVFSPRAEPMGDLSSRPRRHLEKMARARGLAVTGSRSVLERRLREAASFRQVAHAGSINSAEDTELSDEGDLSAEEGDLFSDGDALEED